ncbi:MAG: cellulase family glycosylhydrolase [Lachnospiraceae bacterium]|nr:cellulase family glycosylhydrolase [Lachnospiraceae bacterium]
MKHQFRRIVSLILLTLLLTTGVASAAPSRSLGAERKEDGLTGCSATEIVSMMELGFNIGNTFDATGGSLETHETQWGNPKVTQRFIDAVYDAGFNTVRLPVTWMNFISNDGTYTIDPAYLARVKEVVDYCYNDGLFVILNVHHEGWVNVKDLDTSYPAVGEELNAVWTQIATYFANYDQHLIFEGMNEPRMAGTAAEWNGTPDGYSAVNYLNQVFVNAVRSTGLGHNDERCLMIPGYAASCSGSVLQSIAMPTYNGEPAGNIIISVHSYTPYEFCLTDEKETFMAGVNSSSIDSVFRDIQSNFLKYGIPVVIGETGATNSHNNTKYRADWFLYTATKAAMYGVPMIVWDNGAMGSSGGECHSYINRRTYVINYPEILDAMKEGWNSVKRGSALTEVFNPSAAEPDPDASFSYRANGYYYASSADGKPANPSISGMRFLGWYVMPDYQAGSEFTGVVPKGTRTVYAKLALTDYKAYRTSLTPASLPDIEPREQRPLPSATPTPIVSPEPTEPVTETVTPEPTQTETAVSETPTPTPVPGDGSYNPVIIYMMLAVCIAMIVIGIALVVRGIRRHMK